MSGGAGQAMSAQRSWGFRLPVWRSKADKLAQALGDYVVERGRVRITPLVRWNSWGVVIEVSHFRRGERHIGDPLGEQRTEWRCDARVQIGPCIFITDVMGSYSHRNFHGEDAVQTDEPAKPFDFAALQAIRKRSP